jgi:hypothetical protein
VDGGQLKKSLNKKLNSGLNYHFVKKYDKTPRNYRTSREQCPHEHFTEDVNFFKSAVPYMYHLL